MKIRAGVFFGGRTVEHEVSVISAMQAIAALDREKYDVIPVYISKDNAFYTGEHLGNIETWRDIPSALKAAVRVVPANLDGRPTLLRWPAPRFGQREAAVLDVAIPVVHGTGVEDGALQGLLEYLGAPYTGCDVAASAAGMDKWTMKCLFRAAGIPVAPGVRLTAGPFYADTAAARIAGELGAACLVTMTDVAGILRDREDPDTLIRHIDLGDVPRLIETGVIAGGMIPKAQCCTEAIRRGVQKVFIIDGRVPHAVLIELLTDEGLGTMFEE